MPEALNVELRETRGKREARRMRREGKVPAVLYGHGQDNLSLTVSEEQLAAAIRHGTRLVDLKGAANETALIRELQWDTFGTNVLHLDFARVSADERIEVEVAVELRGEAPGVKDGGVIEHLLHQLRVECPAIAIPDKLRVSINSLALKGQILVKDVKLPDGATVLDDPEEIVVQCVEPAAESDEETGGEAAEPELIGRKREDEEEGEEE
jgi:large subunit ribosomal protein L25